MRLLRTRRRARLAANIDAYAKWVLITGCVDHRRRRSPLPVQSLPEAVVDPCDGGLRLMMLQPLPELPPRSRAVVVLRYGDDLSVEDMGTALGISTGTVKSVAAPRGPFWPPPPRPSQPPETRMREHARPPLRHRPTPRPRTAPSGRPSTT